MGWSFIINPGGESHKDPPLQCQNIFLTSRDSLRGVLHPFECSSFLPDILHCSCNKNWMSINCLYQLSLHQNSLVGSFWTRGDWSFFCFIVLNTKPQGNIFPCNKRGKRRMELGLGSCVTAVNICLCEALSWKSTRLHTQGGPARVLETIHTLLIATC